MSLSNVEHIDAIFRFEKIYEASIEQLFEAFTNEKWLKKWWGPHGWEVTKCKVLLKPQGYWHFCLKCKDKESKAFGAETWGLAKYIEIEAPNRLVYEDYIADKKGRVLRNTAVPQITLQFEQMEDKRAKVICSMNYKEREALQKVLDLGLEQGIRETYEKLEEVLKHS